MNNTELTVPQVKVKEGILDICQYLRLEMIRFLDEEGRNRGTVKSYMNNLKSIFERMNQEVSEEDCDIYDHVLAALRGQIYSDFKRLLKKRLSMADCIIVIMKRILDTTKSIDTIQDFRFTRELDSVLKVITKLYDNIRNRGKEDSLYLMKSTVEKLIYSGELPERIAQKINLYSIGHPVEKIKTIDSHKEILSEVTLIREINL